MADRKILINGLWIITGFLLLTGLVTGQTKPNNRVSDRKEDRNNTQEDFSAYLFTYFTGSGPGEEAIRYAISADGFNFRALNNNQPILDSKMISTSGGVRDPHILRGEDGKFYMVATDLYVPEMGWSNFAMVMLTSGDLIHWTSSIVNIPDTFPEKFGTINRVWAPQTIYDPESSRYMLYWSMRTGKEPDRIYYAFANDDFTGLQTVPKQLFYSPDNSACIDGDIIRYDGNYYLFFKNESTGGGILKALSDKLTTGYVQQEGFVDQTDEAVEGSGIFRLNNSNEFILMYDVYKKGRYQFCKSDNLENFTVIDKDISMDFHPRHGTVLPITQEEAKKLVNKWGTVEMGTAIDSLKDKK